MQPSFSPSRSRAARLIGALGVAATLAGCQTTSSRSYSLETNSIPGGETIDPAFGGGANARLGAAPNEAAMAKYARTAAEIAIREGKLHGATAHLARVFKANPRDKRIAYELARHMRYLGGETEAEQVLSQAMRHHPNDPLLRLELGKVRIAAGKGRGALKVLEPLAKERPKDPAVLQALGVAYDRLGRHKEAQTAYETAISRTRPTAALLNNYALSQLLGRNLSGAIKTFRKAAVAPGATAQVRLNLAMALALGGKGREARRIARKVAPKGAAEEIVSYFEKLAAAGVEPADAWGAAAGQKKGRS